MFTHNSIKTRLQASSGLHSQRFSLNTIQQEKIDPDSDTDPDTEDAANRGRYRYRDWNRMDRSKGAFNATLGFIQPGLERAGGRV